MTSHDLTDRADLDAMLHAFYGCALNDELLGPVFASAGMDLAAHLPRIAFFWEVALLGPGSTSNARCSSTDTSPTPPVSVPLTFSDGPVGPDADRDVRRSDR